MAETRMPYGKTGFWFVRMPCWLNLQPQEGGAKLDIVSRDSGKTVSLALRPSRMGESMTAFAELTRIYEARNTPDMAGVDAPNGAHAVVLYGVSVGQNAEGLEVLDLAVQGGSVKVEPADPA